MEAGKIKVKGKIKEKTTKSDESGLEFHLEPFHFPIEILKI